MQSWLRQKHERRNNYDYFLEFLSLGENRNIQDLSEKLNKKSDYLEGISNKWNWNLRISDFENYYKDTQIRLDAIERIKRKNNPTKSRMNRKSENNSNSENSTSNEITQERDSMKNSEKFCDKSELSYELEFPLRALLDAVHRKLENNPEEIDDMSLEELVKLLNIISKLMPDLNEALNIINSKNKEISIDNIFTPDKLNIINQDFETMELAQKILLRMNKIK